MNLKGIQIKGFRSIEDLTLNECGEFNVIVGKNNAGKSNILLSIDAFFDCLKKGEPVIINPKIGEVIDHHNQDVDVPIEVSILFELSVTERERIIQDIVSEAPQVRNTIENMDPRFHLLVTASFSGTDNAFAYISRMALCNNDEPEIHSEESYRTILNIGDAAAIELADRIKRARQREREAEFLQKSAYDLVEGMDEEDWGRLKSEPSFIGRHLRYRRVSPRRSIIPTRNIALKLEELVRSSDSRADFRESVLSLRSSLEDEANEIRSQPISNKIDSFSGQETAVPDYAINLIRRIGEIELLYLTERREQIGKEEASRLLDLKVRRGGPEKLKSIQETVSALLGVEIDAFRAESSQSRDNEEAELDVDQFLVQVNGAGIREALRLILDYEFKSPNILLVEETEIHLHPALETSMMRYLKTIGNECQIFVTTHSTNFLDTAEMRNVYLATRNGSTQVQLINIEEAEENIPHEMGIRLSSLFMFERLVFVEGSSDEDVLREIGSTVGVNFAKVNLGFISMGGVRNLSHFAAEATMEFLTKRRVHMWFLLDRDERGEDDINRLAEKVGENAELVVLNKREIENYLIAPRAISEFIALKMELAGKEPEFPTEQEVRDAIQAVADEMQDIAIERRVVKRICKPIYPDRNKILAEHQDNPLAERISRELSKRRSEVSAKEDELEVVIDEETEYVTQRWKDEKLSLVPGDLLLDNVCRTFGVRFKKERDAARLAALLTESDIDSELKELLTSFVDERASV